MYYPLSISVALDVNSAQLCPFCVSDQGGGDGSGHRQRAGRADKAQPSGWGHHLHGEGHGAAGGSARRAAEEPDAGRQRQRGTQPQ